MNFLTEAFNRSYHDESAVKYKAEIARRTAARSSESPAVAPPTRPVAPDSAHSAYFNSPHVHPPSKLSGNPVQSRSTLSYNSASSSGHTADPKPTSAAQRHDAATKERSLSPRQLSKTREVQIRFAPPSRDLEPSSSDDFVAETPLQQNNPAQARSFPYPRPAPLQTTSRQPAAAQASIKAAVIPPRQAPPKPAEGFDADELFDGVDFDDDGLEEERERDHYEKAVPIRQKTAPTFHLPIVPSKMQLAIPASRNNLPIVPGAKVPQEISIDVARVSSAPKFQHPWSRDVDKALRHRFGLRGFRPNQEEAINATLSGKDVFVLLPTGGGKSLCFQLPAVVSSGKTRGVTIVVSPLLSLISDQCKSLEEKDIPVIYLNSTMSAADRNFAMSTLRSEPPTSCLAYVTPEQVSYPLALINFNPLIRLLL